MQARKFLKNLKGSAQNAENLTNQMLKYKAEEPPFDQVFQGHPLQYWKTLPDADTKELGNIARRVLGAHPSAAPVERSFSRAGSLKTSERNSMAPETLAAMMAITTYNGGKKKKTCAHHICIPSPNLITCFDPQICIPTCNPLHSLMTSHLPALCPENLSLQGCPWS